MGFGVPIDAGFAGRCATGPRTCSMSGDCAARAISAPEPIRHTWEAHLSGRVNEQYRLWGVLMFQSWLAAQGQGHGQGVAATPPVAALAS